MRLAQVTPSLEERHGGPSKSIRLLSASLARLGHDVTLFTTGPVVPSAEDGGLRVESHARGRPQSLCASPGLRARLLGFEADVFHHHSIWLRTLHYARLAASRRASPLVLSPRGMMSRWAWRHHSLRKALAGRFVHPGAFASVAGWHATSEAEADDIRALGFTQPVCVAPNGVGAPPPGEAEAAALHWHAACPAAVNRPVALFYSRFHRKKRVLELIDAWLRHAPADWLLLLVGIPQEYTVSSLESYVLRASGSGRVRVFDGVGRPPPYAIASLFVLPSHSENFGLAIAEALASGVPALVTDATPWRELGSNGGWCVPWEDFPEALRGATAEGPARLRERGARARDWVLREYSWERPARILAGFYAQLKGQTP